MLLPLASLVLSFSTQPPLTTPSQLVSKVDCAAFTRVSSGARKNLVLACVDWGSSVGSGEREGEEPFGSADDVVYDNGFTRLGARHLMDGRPGACPRAEEVLGPHTCTYITLTPDIFLEEG